MVAIIVDEILKVHELFAQPPQLAAILAHQKRGVLGQAGPETFLGFVQDTHRKVDQPVAASLGTGVSHLADGLGRKDHPHIRR
jgi:hypothetical protein